jgi:hypothetical protein
MAMTKITTENLGSRQVEEAQRKGIHCIIKFYGSLFEPLFILLAGLLFNRTRT